MRPRYFLLVFLVTALTFANCLANGFLGDSLAMFAKGTFYKNPAHLRVVFSRDLVMSSKSFLARGGEEVTHTGFISYRPVTALTFFADAFLYKNLPAGFHFTNILLHLATVMLVFLLAFRLLGSPGTALLAALLFGVHPIQSEVVSSIGYRSDLLAALFMLGGLLTFWSAVSAGGARRRLWFAASYACFFLAIFSKETGLAFFPLLILMDFFFLRPPSSRPARHLRERAAAYAGYAAILGFFLYIYFIAFPSEHYPHYSFLNLAGREQGVVALKILFAYFKVLLLPFTVTVLPPLYTPPAFPVHPLFLAFTILAVVFSFVGAWRAYPKNKVVPFAVLWFWLAYLPASNIILLPNPLAFRFMYFPSVGVFLLMGLGLSRLAAVLKRRVPSARLDILVPAAVIGVCASAALANNSFFKNDLSACREMVRNYPDASRPYWNLGLAFLDRGQFAVAAKYLDRYRRADPRNPFVIPPDKDPQFLYTRGRVEVDNPDAAIAYFRAALRLKPDYMFVWQDLAKAFLLKKDYRSAEEAALVAIRIDGKAPLSYVYAVHSAVELGHFADAGALLKKVEAFASDDENVRWVAAFFRERRRAKEAGR